MKINWAILCRASREAQARAYAPYSQFKVGASLLCIDGTIVTGCNVENVSYSLTQCAERVALARAIAEGHRHFLALVVSTSAKLPTPPCGACRQVLAEFRLDLPLRCYGAKKSLSTNLRLLLPKAFAPQNLR